ncbi:LysR family transcriptional regulator [Yoonia sediminilitoris]|uniref:LysR family transcriptional regulator n=1 Tax=Yoonia sediminilitoris TaxID=1286148 RepID=A0A2T6KQ15_9RHOB|nr:LysR family transcriptional regulator [Yoonia sediminilitoris]PUB18649.1 LysR family transcriptional regulator [Yoonia sediminilitoris]RCW98817.1 LysR family transcriptional regulator [Yoonia sediminilitoris]
MRNLDLTALRSFMTVADTGGVTRAAGMLNLTQSAVSMQLKRLEESLNVSLLDRSSRTIGLTPAGEQLLGYARRMLSLNDEICHRLTATDYKGELKLGVPHDIIYPTVPEILRRFAADFPQMQVRLISAPTRQLLAMFGRGEVDLILTTEETCGAGGRELVEVPLLWIGAKDGDAWRKTPLPVAFCSNCIFRSGTLQALNNHGVDWQLVVDSESDNAVDVAVSADLAVHVALAGNLTPHTVAINHGGALPPLSPQKINLYVLKPDDPVSIAMAEIVQQSYAAAPAQPMLAAG